MVNPDNISPIKPFKKAGDGFSSSDEHQKKKINPAKEFSSYLNRDEQENFYETSDVVLSGPQPTNVQTPATTPTKDKTHPRFFETHSKSDSKTDSKSNLGKTAPTDPAVQQQAGQNAVSKHHQKHRSPDHLPTTPGEQARGHTGEHKVRHQSPDNRISTAPERDKIGQRSPDNIAKKTTISRDSQIASRDMPKQANTPDLTRYNNQDEEEEDTSELVDASKAVTPEPVHPETKVKDSAAPSKDEDSGEDVDAAADDYYDMVAQAPALPKESAGLKETPFTLYRKLTESEKTTENPYAWETVSSESPTEIPREHVKRSDKVIAAHFEQEQPDLSYVNPFAPVTNVDSAQISSKEPLSRPAAVSNIKEIVEQMVKEMYRIEQSGQTSTVVVIQHPPIFEDAHIVVTSFDSATKEYNLAFENLTPQAKQLLDSNLSSLKMALEEKGYAKAIHIITTTTLIEHNIPTSQSETEHHEDQGGGGSFAGGEQQDQHPNEEDLA